MTLEQAIIHAREKAQECSGTTCGDQHLQLAIWLEELVRYRKASASLTIKEDDDLPEVIPIQMVTETFGGMKIETKD